MKMKQFIRGLLATALMAAPVLAAAQDFEDDIYYNPSKTQKKTVKAVTVKNYQPTPDYPAADTYTPGAYTFSSNPSTRDIDEYNRRTTPALRDTITVNADTLGEFLYTQRIEKFHNPDVVTQTGDADLIDYYYSQPQTTSSVNIYVNNGPYWNSWNYPYRYSWAYYDPWYWNSWGPSWSYYNPWYWNSWDPYWGWSWNWGPSYYPGGWYPPHHWGPNPGWHPTWRPVSHGSSRPHASTTGGGTSNRRPGASGTGYYGGSDRRGSTANGAGNSVNTSTQTRPGNMGRGRYGNNTATPVRPSTGTTQSGNGYSRPSSSGNRNVYGGGTSTGSSSTRRSTTTPSYNTNRGNSGSNRSSYGGSSSGRSSYGGGASYGGSSGRGSYGGGGGGGRGRR